MRAVAEQRGEQRRLGLEVAALQRRARPEPRAVGRHSRQRSAERTLLAPGQLGARDAAVHEHAAGAPRRSRTPAKRRVAIRTILLDAYQAAVGRAGSIVFATTIGLPWRSQAHRDARTRARKSRVCSAGAVRRARGRRDRVGAVRRGDRGDAVRPSRPGRDRAAAPRVRLDRAARRLAAATRRAQPPRTRPRDDLRAGARRDEPLVLRGAQTASRSASRCRWSSSAR